MLKRPVLRKLVQDAILDLIIEEGLKPGDTLPYEGKIAEKLGVSRTSVREGVRSLEALGIVETIHGRGNTIREYNLDAILDLLSHLALMEPVMMQELLQMRIYLEESILSEVARNFSVNTLEQCNQALRRWKVKIAEGLSPWEEDRLFHEALYVSTGNQLLIQMMEVFWNAESLANKRSQPGSFLEFTAKQRQAHLSDHRKIIEALEQGDVVSARNALRKSFRGSEKSLREAMKKLEAGNRDVK